MPRRNRRRERGVKRGDPAERAADIADRAISCWDWPDWPSNWLAVYEQTLREMAGAGQAEPVKRNSVQIDPTVPLMPGS